MSKKTTVNELEGDKVEELLSEYDLDKSRLRVMDKRKVALASFASVIAILMSIFQIYTAGFGTLITFRQRSLHILFAFTLGFLFYPGSEIRKKNKKEKYRYFKNLKTIDIVFLFLYSILFIALYMELIIKPLAIILGIISSFILYSGYRPTSKTNVDPLDIFYTLISILVFGYIFVNYKEISLKGADYSNIDLLFGGFAIMITLEVTRRVVGYELPLVAIVFLLYGFLGPLFPGVLAHKGYRVGRIVSQMYLTTEGIMGIPLGVSATFVFMFILFGSFLDKTGVGKFFIDIAYALTGHLKSGPAMTAVLASGFMGSISGSSVANTVTTGAFTIPLMIKSGYKPHFAGAVEAAASTGGQIMPPVMGAAAFIMAEFTGIAYKDIIIAALIPAILYYFAVAVTVHLEASRLGLEGMEKSKLPSAKNILREQGYLLLPLLLIVGLLVMGMTPTISAYYAIVFSVIVAIVASLIKGGERGLYVKMIPLTLAMALLLKDFIKLGDSKLLNLLIASSISIVLSLIINRLSLKIYEGGNKQTRDKNRVEFGLGMIVVALEEGAKGAVGVACACACAGMIVCIVTLTGLGLRLAGIIVSMAGGNLLLTLLFTMIASIILGMGLPTTAKYIVLATMAVPALLQLDVNLMSGHLFILYFGVVADITPPVALAAYAGAGIAGANSMKTGVQAFKIALAAFIVPYLFAMNPELILIKSVTGSTVEFLPIYSALPIVISALIGIVCLAATVEGYLISECNLVERAALFVSAILLLNPGFITDIIGLFVLVGIFILQKKKIRIA